jgi:hypothetical protein
MLSQKSNYSPPDNPADPEAAALELIVRLPASISDVLAAEVEAAGLTQILQDYCGALDAEGAFSGLSWADAKPVAAAVCFDIMNRDDAADFIRNRARNVLAGTDNMRWEHREKAARALNIAATVLGL